MTISRVVAVILTFASITFAAGLQIAVANQMLRDFKWLIPYLWTASGLLLLLAIWTAFHPNKQETYEARVTAMVRKIRAIKNTAESGTLIANIIPDKKDAPEIFAEAMRRIKSEDEKKPVKRFESRY